MLLKGVHPKVVSERLGHASIGITLDTYSHVLPTMPAEAVRAFDELFPAATGESGRLASAGLPLLPHSERPRLRLARGARPSDRSAPRTGG